MKTLCNEQWDRLMAASMDTRDGLRRVLRRLEAAGSSPLLAEIRSTLEYHMSRLQQAIKHPRWP